MGSLGSFGVAKRQAAADREPDSIEFCGQTFTLADLDTWTDSLAFMEYAAAAMGGMHSGSIAARGLTHNLLREALGDDWARFRAHADTEGATIDDLVPVLQVIVEAATGRPTSRPSASSDGPSATTASSKGSSSSGESSTPPPHPAAHLVRVPNPGPVMSDPRVVELRPVTAVGGDLMLGKVRAAG